MVNKGTEEGTSTTRSIEELRRLVAEGCASGEPVDGETALTQMRAKYRARAASKT